MIKRLVRHHLRKRYERFPERLSIEITTHCNSRCIMCPRTQMTRKAQDMPLDLYEKILADCYGKSVKKVNLFWFGDSFCHPKIIEYLQKARAALPQAKLYISTNAGLLKPEHSDTILENRLLDVINFDIDGMKKETYESIRVGVNFDRVLKNVEYLIQKKRELGLKKPEVRATIIKMKQTAPEIDAFKKHWSEKADCVEVNDYNTWLGNMEDCNVGESLAHSRQGAFTYPCIHPWNELVVAADGTAGLCCLDFDLTAPLGHVGETRLEEIWQGHVMNEYREKLVNLDYDGIACCRNCNAYLYQDRTFWAKLWKR